MQPEQVVKRIVNGFNEKQLKFAQLPNNTSLEDALKSIEYTSNDGTIAELCECYAYYYLYTNVKFVSNRTVMNVPDIMAKALKKGDRLFYIVDEIENFLL